MLDRSLVRWLLALLAVLAIIGLLAYARGDPGDGGRQPDPPGSSAPASAAPPQDTAYA